MNKNIIPYIRSNILIMLTIILLILEVFFLIIPYMWFYYYMGFVYVSFPIIILYSLKKTLNISFCKCKSLLIVSMIIIIHTTFYIFGIKYIYLNKYYYNYPLFVMLFESIVSIFILILIMILLSKFHWHYLIYCIIIGFLAFGSSWFIYWREAYNYLFWQFYLSLVINSYIKKVKLKRLNE
jgi:hypothetical protein